MTINKRNINNLFYIFVTAHLIIWILVPSITNNNLPLDTIEALAWASNLDWGFNKHPPASAFLVKLIYKIFGNKDWAYYLFSQMCVLISFFVVWKLSEDFFKKKIHGLISVLVLEGIYFYNYTTPEFNVYVCELPFWALTVFYCWKGFKYNKINDWLIFGLFAALGVLSHYLFIYLLIALDLFFLYMIVEKKIDFKCLISLITFFLVLTPHIIWLSENNYVTFYYGLHRTGIEEFNFLSHFTHPFIFLGKQIGILIPFFSMLIIIISKIKTQFDFKDKKLIFLMTISILPIILIFLTSMAMGVKIRTMWMTPFYLYMGTFFVYIYKEKINLKKINSFISLFLILFIFSPFVYAYVSIKNTNKRTDYHGKDIADLVQARWDKNFSNEITHVIGDEWFGGNLSYHLKNQPKWFNNIEGKIENLDKTGGIVYTGNSEALKQVCPGMYVKIENQGFCMIGNK